MDAYRLSDKEVLSQVSSSSVGLSQSEATHRLAVYGPNDLRVDPPTSWFFIFLSQFNSPIVWILLAAMLISAVAKEYVDFFVIGAIVVLNSVLGFVQEFRAETAINSLKKMMSLKATVLRDGVARKIDASDVVLGDVLLLESGDRVSADARLIECLNLATQEASLTGESTPVRKSVRVIERDVGVSDRSNMVFAGTDVSNGHARAVVVATGMSSEVGRIASMIQESSVQLTPLQVKLKNLGFVLGVLVLGVALFSFVLGVASGQPWIAMLLAAIALAVAAIPEGLPAVVTISLAVGVQRMAKRNALVRRLPAVETLGACTVILTDKTGTLTHNQMTVTKLFVNQRVIGVTGGGYEPVGRFTDDVKGFDLLLRIGALNNNAKLNQENGVWSVVGDPTEGALLVVARKAGLDVESLHDKFPRSGEFEFSSERKLMTTIHNKSLSYVKGAPEVVISKCNRIWINGRVLRLTTEMKRELVDQNERFANQALRVLGFAFKDLTGIDGKEPEKNLVFVGLQAMIDPPRKEAKEAVEKCVSAGVRVVMVTGDHATTAQAIARELGISGRVVSGDEFSDSVDVSSVGVFARVAPAHKLAIVKAWQARGDVVAVTGDGVNDAPALKKADLGVAMGSGTDVAKDASAMILADDNFASIVKAIEQGRRIYDNIQKYLAYLLSGNIAEVLVILSALLFGMPLPLIAIHILWVNLVTDGLPALALGADPLDASAMSRPPRRAEKSIFKGLGHYLLVYPLILTAGTMALFSVYSTHDLQLGQTVAFTCLVFFELFQAISCRSLSRPVFSVGVFKNKWLIAAVFGSVLLHLTIMYVPFLSSVFKISALSLTQWGVVLLVSSLGFIYLELHKALVRERLVLVSQKQ